MKKKSTQFRWLVTMLLLVAAMAMPKMAWAQNQMFTELSSGTLTFKYGEKPTGGEGITVYDIPDASSSPGWYSQASSITTVVFDESFKDARPTRCYAWFQNCTSLTTINGIENLNTEDVTDMEYMFFKCSSLTTLDLSGFNTAKVEFMGDMFSGCSKLTTIYVSDNFKTSAVTSSADMFTYCESLVGAIKYDSSKTDANYANTTNGYFSIKGSETNPKGAYVVYTDADNTLTFKYGEIPTAGEGITVYDIPDASSSPGWSSQVSSIKTVVFDESFKDIRPTRCYDWFCDCTSLTTINGIENLNTEDVIDMRFMFYNCSSLSTLDLSGFNTAKVESMGNMFFDCSKLTTIYVSDKFTTAAVTSSADMFKYCTSLVGAIKYDSNKTDANYANTTDGYFSYGINTADDLKTFANKVNGTYTPAEGETATANPKICAGLMADITLTDADALQAIGSGGYSGTFDGCGHTISGLNFSSTTSALFAQNSGTIKNLGIAEATIAEGASGSLCQTNSGTIDHCFFMGTTTGSSQSAGGICQTAGGTITNCYYLADSETDAIEGTIYKTTAQFKSGEVCYLLNEGKTDGTQIWYQNLSAEGDTWPVCNNTGNNTVYYAILFCGGTSNAGNTYANTTKVKIDHDMTEDVSLNTTKHIYQKGCQREGCGYADYYATSDGSVVAKETSEGVFTAVALTLVDATKYDNQAVFTATDFTYTRTFSSTNWTTWYVPFELTLTKDICDNFAFSRINNVHQYDTDNDGNADKTVVESFRQTEGVTLKANYPYLVKALSESDLKMELNLKNVQPALAETNSIDCQSVDFSYTFMGTYTGMREGGSGYYDPYTLWTDGTWRHFQSLDPMRHYLTVTPRNSFYASATSLRSIMLSVIGDEGTTGIVNIYDEERRAKETYDLGGRRIPAGSQRNGFYIENGKVIYKK